MQTLGRPRQLPAALFTYDFVKLAKREKNARKKIRFLALFHVQLGKSYKEIGEMLKVHPFVIPRWIKRLACEGLKGLEEHKGRGRKRLLNSCEAESLREAVNHLQDERPGGRARVKDIQILLREKFSAYYALSSVYHVLSRAKMSWITSRSKHPQADIAVQEAFKKTL